MTTREQRIAAIEKDWAENPRWAGIKRGYTAADVERLRGSGIVVLFAGLKKQVVDVMQATGLRAAIGEKAFFASAEHALEAIYSRAENLDAADGLRPLSAPLPEKRFG